MYQWDPRYHIIFRRIGVIIIGTLALPWMMFRRDKGRCYSYLHRMSSKANIKPV